MYSYVTYLGSDSYLVGVLALNAQLKKFKSKYPLTVITSMIGEHTKYILKKTKINFIEMGYNIKLSDKIKEENKNYGMPQWNNTFGKLSVFGLTQFKKIVYLDSDMLIRENIDELFKKPNLSSVISGTKYPGNESWSKTLNSGLMVLVPKYGEDKRLISILEDVENYESLGDQDIIHMGYPKWSVKLNLGEEFNLMLHHEAYYLAKKIVKHSTVKVVHFTGKEKPWMITNSQLVYFSLRLLKNSVKVNKSLKGIIPTFDDYFTYFKICKEVKKGLGK